MEVQHVVATNRERVWKYRMMREVIWQECNRPRSSVRLQLEDLDVKCPRCCVVVSLDNRNMNVQETCADDVKKFMITWLKREVLESLKTARDGLSK